MSRRIIPRLVILLVACSVGLLAIYFWPRSAFEERSLTRDASEMPSGVYFSRADQWADFYARRTSEGTGWIHLPELYDEPEFVSDIDPFRRGFVEPHICGECHPDKYEGLVETAHYRTSELATRETVLGDFSQGENRLETKDPHLQYEMVADEDELFQSVAIEKGGKQYEHRRPFDIVMGSGNHGQTYLYWERDQLFQLPVSYFVESGWINSPGNYRDGTADFARGVGDRCLECHATFFASDQTLFGRHDASNFILGVTCVRCHGPGWAHVQYHRHHPEAVEAKYIVHPGNLPRPRANEVCAQCHSGVGLSIQPPFSFRPGEPLANYLELDMNTDDPKNDDPHAANQLLRLMKSRCFNESDTMTCITCHDPHQNERGNLRLFAERCAKCHEVDACHMSEQLGDRIRYRCVQCHMPSRRDSEGAMETASGLMLPLLRDHLIKGWPDATQQVLRELDTSVDTPGSSNNTQAEQEGGDSP